MKDELKRLALFGSGVAELTRNRAERIAQDLARSSDERRQHVSSLVKELVEVSRDNRREMLRFLKAEVEDQVRNLGLVTKRDVDRLERRVARLEATGTASSGKKTTTKKTAKKSATKSTAKKSARKARKKTTASKSTATPA